jgi:hypothetical protein
MCDDCQREVVMGYGLVEQLRTASLYQTVRSFQRHLLRWQSFTLGGLSSMACEQRTVQRQGRQ